MSQPNDKFLEYAKALGDSGLLCKL